MLTQEELDKFAESWKATLPALGAEGAPFYTLMKFNGDTNLGEVFAYPGVNLGFDVHIMTVTLFPTAEIARTCEEFLRKSNPQWRAVGLSEEFLDLLLELVRVQQLKLSISLTPEDSVVFATRKVPELAAKIREQGFSEDLLKVEEAEETVSE